MRTSTTAAVPISAEHAALMFPALSDEHIEPVPFFVLERGRLDVFRIAESGEQLIVSHGPGAFTGEANMLLGRPSLMRTRAVSDGEAIVALEGARRLERVVWRRKVTGETETRDIRHVFMMTGAVPNTAWIRGCLALDDKGFVKTGTALTSSDLKGWRLTRPPQVLETSLPAVFAVGDVRSGSMKRVASAVGEGSTAISLVHQTLAG